MRKGIAILLVFASCLINAQENYSGNLAEATKVLNRTKIDSVAKKMGFKGGESITVYVNFKVNSEGTIKGIRARGPHKIFEKEVIKMMKEIPKVDPPKNLKKGEIIKYTLPIKLVVSTDEEIQKRNENYNRN